jgi:hypothetical protein
MDAIPDEWIKQYVDKWIALAERFPPGGMRDAAIARAGHVMDMVEVWRNRETSPPREEGKCHTK